VLCYDDVSGDERSDDRGSHDDDQLEDHERERHPCVAEVVREQGVWVEALRDREQEVHDRPDSGDREHQIGAVLGGELAHLPAVGDERGGHQAIASSAGLAASVSSKKTRSRV
jgi:hypothetical protein